MTNDEIQSFGAGWTEEKLVLVRRYLVAYLEALKNQPFKKMFVDAFAGEGRRREEREGFSSDLFPDELSEPASVALLDGSARIALELDPGFDRYVFIEKDASRSAKLESMAKHYPGRRAEIRNGDANEELLELCRFTNWRDHRGVLFLDPFGLSVEWETLERVAETKALDVWFLVPIGALFRLMKKDGAIPDGWRKRLDKSLGEGWYESFFRTQPALTLFGDIEESIERRVNVVGLSDFILGRLRSLFPAVASNPRLFRNSKGAPLFLLCFAASNPKGGKIALRIAQHILRDSHG